MDTAHWPQEIVVKPIEEIVTNTCPKPGGGNNNLERKISKPIISKDQQQVLNCPRCNSTNTKFCYYNNYSLTQPRYFCKTCRRYWTEGGSLRNIPVGGGSRKNKKSSISLNNYNNSSSSSNNSSIISCISNSKKLPDLITPPSSSSSNNSTHQQQHQFQNPNNQDLNLAFPSSNNNGTIRSFSELIHQLPNNNKNIQLSCSSGSGSAVAVAAAASDQQLQSLSALELLTGFSSRGLNSFLPSMQIHHHHHHQDPNSSGFNNPLQDFKLLPSLNFSLDGGYGIGSSMQENTSGSLLFPFEDLKQVSSNNINNNNNNGENDHDQQNREQGDDHSAGYWSGMLGGGNGSW